MTERIECTIDSFSKSRHKIDPIIVLFEHGKLEPEHASGLKCGVYHDNLMTQVVAVETPDTRLYQGAEDSTKLTRTLIAIRNKITNKVRLLGTSTIQLSPVLEQTQVPKVAEASTSSISSLNRYFGSKRSLRQTERYEKTHTNVDSMSEQLSKAIENVSGDLDLAGYVPEAETYTFLPPRNPDAKSPELVYELDKMLTSSELQELMLEANNLLQFPEIYDDDENSILFSTLVQQAIRRKNTKLIAALLYAECIVRILRCTNKDFRSFLNNICPFSELINSNIRKMFNLEEKSIGKLSQSSKDKAVCYLIVLGLMITDFKFDTSLIIRSIKFRSDRLQTLCRIVGVTPMKDNINIVTLKLPLTSIKPFTLRKKKLN